MGYTKAQMLERLREHLPSVNILPIFVLHSVDFYERTNEVVGQVLEFAEGKELVVRSSSNMEDTAECSNAGKFTSVLHVQPKYKHVKDAIEMVCQSYYTAQNQEVLIQPMLQEIAKSGVVFTADLDTLADYYIVNYCDGEDSAAVTSGRFEKLKTYIRYKYSNMPIDDKDIEALLEDCKKLEQFLGKRALDIEFAITVNGMVYIFQVRPITTENRNCNKYTNLSPTLERIYKKTKKLSGRHPFLLGRTTCFGVMPDWNPAEILGIRPKKLSISLYKELITDNIWAHQRRNYGYRDLTMHPLMISFCGIPYIDTRITFNSFIPQNLNSKIAEKLVDYYLNKLAECPMYHDKVEFEIVFSCYYLGLRNKLKELLQYGFNENEITRIEFSLLELTNQIIDPQSGLYKQDIEKILFLEENYCRIMESDISLVDKIYWLIEECKTYGTLPFAGVARAGFIAIQFLRSFISMGIITEEEYNSYMNGLDTINRQMNNDLKKYHNGEMSKDQFLEIYGHVRPGTYDITSKRYDEAFDEYFGSNMHMDLENTTNEFSFSGDVMEKIQMELEQNGILVTAEELLVFIKEAIEGREYLKFTFTKTVSRILQLIESLGRRVGICKEDMAHVDISIIKQLYVDLYTGDIRTMLEENIRNNKRQFDSAVQIKLPGIIVKPEDVYSFYLLQEEPNFITQKKVTADTVVFDDEAEIEVQGKVVFIQSADPGYDFLFTNKIAGLITQFGGANSHMAIRCAELGIPAIVGSGEKNYREWSKWNHIMVDCLKRQVLKIR